MTAKLSPEEELRIRMLWLQWQSARPTHQALYFDFHEQVVLNDQQLSHLTLFQTLGALVAHQSDAPPH
jgi:hypothetical protein